MTITRVVEIGRSSFPTAAHFPRPGYIVTERGQRRFVPAAATSSSPP